MGHLDGDTAISAGTFGAALSAAGAVCRAVDRVIAGEVRISNVLLWQVASWSTPPLMQHSSRISSVQGNLKGGVEVLGFKRDVFRRARAFS